MRKYIFLCLSLISFSSLFAQTSKEELYDKAVNQTKRERKARMECQNQLDSLSMELDDLILASGEVSKTIQERDSLRDQLHMRNLELESLREDKSRLQNLLSSGEKKIETLEQEKHEKYLDGRQDVLDEIYSDYEDLTFDQLIIAYSQDKVTRDLKLAKSPLLKQRLKNLDIYFSGKDFLSKRFSISSVNNALDKAKTIKEESEFVKELIDNLDNYKLRNDGLKEAIQKIQVIDENFIANTPKNQNDKEADILAEISWYFYNYKFDFEDYPYLSSKAIEIMKVKHKDANSDISGILEQL
jgi:hypothetical protein